MLRRLSNDFRAATRIVKERCPTPKHGHVLVRRAYAGVNASDVNFTSGKYFGSPEESQKRLPFYAGFESVGVVADIGKGVKGKLLRLPPGASCFRFALYRIYNVPCVFLI